MRSPGSRNRRRPKLARGRRCGGGLRGGLRRRLVGPRCRAAPDKVRGGARQRRRQRDRQRRLTAGTAELRERRVGPWMSRASGMERGTAPRFWRRLPEAPASPCRSGRRRNGRRRIRADPSWWPACRLGDSPVARIRPSGEIRVFAMRQPARTSRRGLQESFGNLVLALHEQLRALAKPRMIHPQMVGHKIEHQFQAMSIESLAKLLQALLAAQNCRDGIIGHRVGRTAGILLPPGRPNRAAVATPPAPARGRAGRWPRPPSARHV